MTMGQYIKYLREKAELSQEELGRSLNPPVNRAAVNKWETGQVENIKRNHIQQLAAKFGVDPCDLMCFDDKFDSPRLSEEANVFDMVQKCFGEDAATLLHQFQELNHLGKEKVMEDIDDLTQIPKYTTKEKTELKKRIGNIIFVDFGSR